MTRDEFDAGKGDSVFGTPVARQLEQLHEVPGRSGGAVGLDIAVVDLAADLFGDRRRDPLWRGVVEVHATTGPVAFEPMADVEVLLEVVAQREVEERPLLGG
jgi:hypothetical protein